MTSHAAVVARQMNRACVVGLEQSVEAFTNVEVISLDGATGRVWTEKVPVISGQTNGVVKDFTAMVYSTLNGVIPIVFDVPTVPVNEALLYLGDQILHPEQAIQTVLLSLSKVQRLYLDLVPSEEESRFLKLVAAHKVTERFLEALSQVLPKHHPLFSRLVVVVKPGVTVAFSHMVAGADLRSLVLSDTEVILDGVDTLDPAIQRVLAWKLAQGLSAVSIGAYVPEAKSMLSVSQALQLIANGKGA